MLAESKNSEEVEDIQVRASKGRDRSGLAVWGDYSNPETV